MKEINTDYKSLSEIDPEIVRFYKEKQVSEVVGITEPDEYGYSEQIYENRTIIVLMAPNEVSYEYASARLTLRQPDPAFKSAMNAAKAHEDFIVNHQQYLIWRVDHNNWQDEHADWVEIANGEQDSNSELRTVEPQEPSRPQVDINNARFHYKEVRITEGRSKWLSSGESLVSWNDEECHKVIEAIEPSDEAWEEFLANPSDAYVKHLKMFGIEFEGVMCSATKEDMWGLSSIRQHVADGFPTKFEFDNGSVLNLTPENVGEFYAVWAPFRASFFQ